MTQAVRIGIDVGGTNTDAVLMSGKDVLTSAKTATTQDVRSGVVEVVSRLMDGWKGSRSDIGAVMIGTTQFVNAFVERRGLEPVAIFRIALPKGRGVPPMAGWPRDLVHALGGHIYMIRGGSYYTGVEYTPLDEEGLRAAAEDAHSKKVRSAVICATFASMRPDLEARAAAIVAAAMPGVRITQSAEVGGAGLNRPGECEHRERVARVAVESHSELASGRISGRQYPGARIPESERRDVDHDGSSRAPADSDLLCRSDQ